MRFQSKEKQSFIQEQLTGRGESTGGADSGGEGKDGSGKLHGSRVDVKK